MSPTRRSLLLSALTAPVLGTAAGLRAQPATPPPAPPNSSAPAAADPRLAERAVGSASAPRVQEWFSLTCTHCARFAREVFPEIRSKLIDTGKLRYVFCDYPLDQTALTAAMVARALPADRYEPFVLALLQSQARWAFDAGANSTDELAKMAALAGMPRDLFDRTVADTGLRTAILAEQSAGEAKYSISATPTFVAPDGRTHSGELGYGEFAKLVGV